MLFHARKTHFEINNEKEKSMISTFVFQPKICKNGIKAFIWYSTEFFGWKLNFDPIFNSIQLSTWN